MQILLRTQIIFLSHLVFLKGCFFHESYWPSVNKNLSFESFTIRFVSLSMDDTNKWMVRKIKVVMVSLFHLQLFDIFWFYDVVLVQAKTLENKSPVFRKVLMFFIKYLILLWQ